MSQNLIILPVAAQVLLTLVIMGLMAGRRRAAIVSGKTRMKDIALGQDAWPEDATKAARSFANQFEMPVLFYVAATLALVTRQVDWLMLALAWAYVASRAAHAVVHVGPNLVIRRFQIYLASNLILLAIWVLLVLRSQGVM